MARCMKMVAVDLGANSGRVILGKYNGDKLEINEVNRFPNIPVQINRTLHWDILGFLREIRLGLKLAGGKYGNDISSIGIDTWGTDFGLIDKKGNLIGNPVHNRDKRTARMME